MKLREYRPEDFERLWELDQRCFSADIAYSRRELTYYLEDRSAICLLGWENQRLRGFILGHRVRGFGHVVTLDVEPEARKLGIGSILMQALEERFKTAGCSSIFLEVAVNNWAALSFYEKHGYSVVKTLRHYYPGDLDGLMMGKKVTKSARSAG